MAQSPENIEVPGLLESLAASGRQVSEFFGSLPDETLLARPAGKWAPLDHWRHLVKSVRPLARALRLPRLLLAMLFGRSKRSSRSYSEIRESYRAALAAGGQAGRFAPTLEDVAPNQAEAWRRNTASEWETAVRDLKNALSKWREEDLDCFQLPHPILGKLTVREMILFTLYHNLHHVENERRRLFPREP